MFSQVGSRASPQDTVSDVIGVDMDGYTLREAAARLGRSPSWVRARIRAGDIHPEQVDGEHGRQYLFTDTDILHAASFLKVPRTPSASVGEAHAIATRAQSLVLQQQERITSLVEQVARLEAERDAQRERLAQVEQEREQERTRLLAERDAERERLEQVHERMEQVKSMGVWDYLRGRHRSV